MHKTSVYILSWLDENILPAFVVLLLYIQKVLKKVLEGHEKCSSNRIVLKSYIRRKLYVEILLLQLIKM